MNLICKFSIIFIISLSFVSCEKNETATPMNSIHNDNLLDMGSNRPNLIQPDSLGALQAVIYRDGQKVMDIHEKQILRYYKDHVYNHKIILESQIDTLDANSWLFRNANNSKEFLRIENILLKSKENKISFEYSYSFNSKKIYVVDINIIEFEENNVKRGGWGKLMKKVAKYLTHIWPDDEGSSNSGIGECTAAAIAACGYCNVAWVEYSTNWYGGDNCSFACK